VRRRSRLGGVLNYYDVLRDQRVGRDMEQYGVAHSAYAVGTGLSPASNPHYSTDNSAANRCAVGCRPGRRRSTIAARSSRGSAVSAVGTLSPVVRRPPVTDECVVRYGRPDPEIIDVGVARLRATVKQHASLAPLVGCSLPDQRLRTDSEARIRHNPARAGTRRFQSWDSKTEIPG
jgi:hypothetical protein